MVIVGIVSIILQYLGRLLRMKDGIYCTKGLSRRYDSGISMAAAYLITIISSPTLHFISSLCLNLRSFLDKFLNKFHMPFGNRMVVEVANTSINNCNY